MFYIINMLLIFIHIIIKYAFDVPCAHGLRKKKIEYHKSLTNTDFTSKFQLYFAAVL